jgi:Flp pilus assembly protein TadD
MRYALALLVIVFSCMLAGCGSSPAYSVRPLYQADEKPVADPRLEGAWTPVLLQRDGVNQVLSEHWTLTGETDGCYRGERRKKDKDKDEDKEKPEQREIYRVCLVALDDKLFFDQELREKNVGQNLITAKDMSPQLAAMHVVGRLWPQQDFLRFKRLYDGWVKNHQPEELRLDIGASVVFTGSTQQLRNIMTQHSDDRAAMSDAWYLCRPGTDCSLQVVEDELTREPDNPDVLHGAAEFRTSRGEYDEALRLLGKRLTLIPENEVAEARVGIGVTRFFKRDFAGARVDLAAASKLDPEDQPFDDFLTGISYFLEGNYAEAHKNFASFGSTPSPDSAMLIILNYAALVRMGRRRQAESFLAERMARFVGEVDDQILLLRATGRVKDFSPSEFTQDELEKSDGALYALVRLAKGDRAAAREALQATLDSVDKGSAVYLGAKIELERLGAD